MPDQPEASGGPVAHDGLEGLTGITVSVEPPELPETLDADAA